MLVNVIFSKYTLGKKLCWFLRKSSKAKNPESFATFILTVNVNLKQTHNTFAKKANINLNALFQGDFVLESQYKAPVDEFFHAQFSYCFVIGTFHDRFLNNEKINVSNDACVLFIMTENLDSKIPLRTIRLFLFMKRLYSVSPEIMKKKIPVKGYKLLKLQIHRAI